MKTELLRGMNRRIILLLFLLLMLAGTAGASCNAVISVSNEIIQIADGWANPSCLVTNISNISRIEQIGNKEYVLKLPISVTSTGIFYVNNSDADILKLRANGTFSYISSSGNLNIRNTSIFGWNESSNNYEKTAGTGRSYILAASGSTFNVRDSNLSYLGYNSYQKEGVTLANTDGVVNNVTSWYNYNGVYCVNSVRCVINNSHIYNVLNFGIRSVWSSNGTIDNNLIWNSTNEGIYTQSSYESITNNTVNITNGDNAIHLVGTASESDTSDHITVNNNTVISGGHSGIDLHDYVHDNIVSNNTVTFSDPSSAAIFVHNYGVNNNIIRDNIAHSNYGQGIEVLGGHHNTFLNNTAYNNSGDGFLIYASNDTIVNNLTSYNNGGYASGGVSFYNEYWFDGGLPVGNYPNRDNHINYGNFTSIYMWNTSGTNYITDLMTSSLTITMSGTGNTLHINFTDNKVFSGISGIKYYPDQSNATLISSGAINISSRILKPSQNYVTSSNTSTAWFINYSSNAVANLTLSTDMPTPINISYANGDTYIIRYLNGTLKETNTSLGGNVNFSSVPAGSYYITEDEATTYTVSGFVNNTLGSALESVSVTNSSCNTATNATGYYQCVGMLNGTYNFSFAKTGYVTGYKEITISGADVPNQNVTLSPQPFSCYPYYCQVYNTTTVQANNLTENTTTSTSYVQLSAVTIPINVSGNFNISFEIKQWAEGIGYGQIYKNNVALGAEHTTSDGVFVIKGELFEGSLNTTDLLEVRGRSSTGAATVYVKNVNLKYDYVPAPVILTPVNNSAQASRIVNITTNASGGIWYQVSQNSDGSSPYINETSNTNYSGNKPLLVGTNYIRGSGYNATENSITNWSTIINVRAGSWIFGSSVSTFVYNERWTVSGTNISKSNLTINPATEFYRMQSDVALPTSRYEMDEGLYYPTLNKSLDSIGSNNGTLYNSSGYISDLFGATALNSSYQTGSQFSTRLNMGDKLDSTNNNLTIFARVRPIDCDAEDVGEIFSKFDWNNQQSYLFDIARTSCIVRGMTSSDGIATTSISTDTGLSKNIWTNVTFVNDYVANKQYIYFNDTEMKNGSASAIFNSSTNSGTALWVGSDPYYVFGNGSIDDIQVWTGKALTVGEITKIINNSHTTSSYIILNHTFDGDDLGASVIVNTANATNSNLSIYSSPDNISWSLIQNNITSGTKYNIQNESSKAHNQYIKIFMNTTSETSAHPQLINITILTNDTSLLGWSNSATETTSLDVNIGTNENIQFNTTLSMSEPISWYVDGTLTKSENSNTSKLLTNFSTISTHTILFTSGTLNKTWNVFVIAYPHTNTGLVASGFTGNILLDESFSSLNNWSGDTGNFTLSDGWATANANNKSIWNDTELFEDLIFNVSVKNLSLGSGVVVRGNGTEGMFILTSNGNWTIQNRNSGLSYNVSNLINISNNASVNNISVKLVGTSINVEVNNIKLFSVITSSFEYSYLDAVHPEYLTGANYTMIGLYSNTSTGSQFGNLSVKKFQSTNINITRVFNSTTYPLAEYASANLDILTYRKNGSLYTTPDNKYVTYYRINNFTPATNDDIVFATANVTGFDGNWDNSSTTTVITGSMFQLDPDSVIDGDGYIWIFIRNSTTCCDMLSNISLYRSNSPFDFINFTENNSNFVTGFAPQYIYFNETNNLLYSNIVDGKFRLFISSNSTNINGAYGNVTEILRGGENSTDIDYYGITTPRIYRENTIFKVVYAIASKDGLDMPNGFGLGYSRDLYHWTKYIYPYFTYSSGACYCSYMWFGTTELVYGNVLRTWFESGGSVFQVYSTTVPTSYMLEDFENTTNWRESGSGGSQMKSQKYREKTNALRIDYNFTTANQYYSLLRYPEIVSKDISMFEGISVDIYGDNSGNKLNITYETNASAYYLFSIDLNYSGWERKQISFTSAINIGGASWNNISTVRLNLTTSSPTSTEKTIYVDRLTFEYPFAIISYSPDTPVSNEKETSREFSVVVSHDSNITWYINGTPVQTNLSVLRDVTTSYTNTSAVVGIWNVSAIANGTDGSAIQTWIWTVVDSPPASITNLQNTTTQSSINWTWTDPADSDFDQVMIYLNGTWITNVSSGTQYYLNSSLTPNSWYELGTHTVDTSGNINQTWVNQTTRTVSEPAIFKHIRRIIIID